MNYFNDRSIAFTQRIPTHKRAFPLHLDLAEPLTAQFAVGQRHRHQLYQPVLTEFAENQGFFVNNAVTSS